jgi:transposase
MRKPIYVRVLSNEERAAVEMGLHSSDAFTLRRCQIILASSRGKRASQVAQDLSCDGDTVTKAINAFNERGVEALTQRSHAVHTSQALFDTEACERLKAIVRQNPRNFGKETSLWTLELAAEVSFEQGLTRERVSDETIRNTLKRLGIQWKRAKQWITSPDPAYKRKKTTETDCSRWPRARWTTPWASKTRPGGAG